MSFWKGKRVLVAGGGGFVGSNLAQSLLHEGANVSITARDKGSRKLAQNIGGQLAGIKVIQAELNEKKECSSAVKDMDFVFCLAAIVGGAEFNIRHPATVLSGNVKITVNMLDAIKESGVKRSVIVSSSNVYPANIKHPLTEDIDLEGNSDPARFGYAWSKKIAELLAHSYSSEFGMKIGIARPFGVYGPRSNFEYESAGIIPRMILNIAQGQPIKIFGNGQQKMSFVYVSDAVECLKLIMQKHPKADPINVGSSEQITLLELAQLISELMGAKAIINIVNNNYVESQDRICDNSKAKRLLGFEPKIRLKEGLQKTIDWYYGIR